MGMSFGATPPGTPERGAASPVPGLALHDYWPSVSSVSDNDDVDVVLDYNDTLFDMLLNSLSIDGNNSSGDGTGLTSEAVEGRRPATPPVQPWAPAPHGAGPAPPGAAPPAPPAAPPGDRAD